MTSHELTTWWVRHKRIEPIGALRDDIRIGKFAVELINAILPAIYKNPKAKVLDDFLFKMMEPAKPIKRQSSKEMAMLLKAIAEAAKSDKGPPHRRAK